MGRARGSRNTYKRKRGVVRPKGNLGVGKGNWGKAGGIRATYDTTFDFYVDKLTAERRPYGYKPTLRGIQEVLGLDGETFNRYRNGKTQPPTVVLKHMEALLYMKVELLPHPLDWALLHHFSIKPELRKSPETGEFEDLFRIEYEHWTFFTPRFPVHQNRKFREFLFQNTGGISYPLHGDEWSAIVDQALTGVYRGELLDPLWKRKPVPLPEPVATGPRVEKPNTDQQPAADV